MEVATGKRIPLNTVVLSDKAGSVSKIRLVYAKASKTYVYSATRVLGTLSVVEGLE